MKRKEILRLKVRILLATIGFPYHLKRKITQKWAVVASGSFERLVILMAYWKAFYIFYKIKFIRKRRNRNVF